WAIPPDPPESAASVIAGLAFVTTLPSAVVQMCTSRWCVDAPVGAIAPPGAAVMGVVVIDEPIVVIDEPIVVIDEPIVVVDEPMAGAPPIVVGEPIAMVPRNITSPGLGCC